MIIDQKAEQEIHKRQLYITQAVFDLCKNHDIRCFLVGGSLLGAVKEQGILKGDKDVDIGMLREDYERFCKVASELPDDLSFLEARTNASYNWLFAKVYQEGTRLIPKDTPLFGPATGIYVDINPYDYVSEDEDKRKAEFKQAKLKKWFMLLKEKPAKKDSRLTLMSILGKTQSREKLIEYFSRGQQKTGIVQNIAGGTEKDWFTVEEVADLQMVNMGESSFPAPGYTRYLDDNYPGWQEKNMSRTELDEFEVEYE